MWHLGKKDDIENEAVRIVVTAAKSSHQGKIV